MWRVTVLSVLLLASTAVMACALKFDPISTPRYYRADGWALPGVSDYKSTAPFPNSFLVLLGTVPGTTTEMLLQRDDVTEFPSQEFVVDGARKRMRAAQYEAALARWIIGGHTIAYSYIMVPVEAHKENGKWKVEGRAGCIFTATFVDQDGDGVFRLLVPGTLKSDLIPRWARPTDPS
jgi:hypothetical protein